jgi:hypothetical protein
MRRTASRRLRAERRDACQSKIAAAKIEEYLFDLRYQAQIAELIEIRQNAGISFGPYANPAVPPRPVPEPNFDRGTCPAFPTRARILQGNRKRNYQSFCNKMRKNFNILGEPTQIVSAIDNPEGSRNAIQLFDATARCTELLLLNIQPHFNHLLTKFARNFTTKYLAPMARRVNAQLECKLLSSRHCAAFEFQLMRGACEQFAKQGLSTVPQNWPFENDTAHESDYESDSSELSNSSLNGSERVCDPLPPADEVFPPPPADLHDELSVDHEPASFPDLCCEEQNRCEQLVKKNTFENCLERVYTKLEDVEAPLIGAPSLIPFEPVDPLPEIKKPAARQPAARRPRKPAARRPEACQPTARQPTARKQTARKPAARKPAARKPARPRAPRRAAVPLPLLPYDLQGEHQVLSNTLFVLGSDMNKALGFETARARIYSKHSNLFRYRLDTEDRPDMLGIGALRRNGAKPRICFLSDLHRLQQHEEYQPRSDEIAEMMENGEIEIFTLPPDMVARVRISLAEFVASA